MLVAAPRMVVLDPTLVPVHCEAYPSFLVAGVIRRWREGVRRCEWLDEHQTLAAQMDLKSCTASELRIHYSCGSETDRRQRGADFPIVMHPQLSRRLEPRTLCPACSTVKQRLFLRGHHWACQQCHGLVERRVLLTTRDKEILRRDKLTNELYARNAPVRSTAADAFKRHESRELQARLGTDAVTRLSPPMSHVVTPVWVGPDDMSYERQAHERGPAYLDLTLPHSLGRRNVTN